MLYSGIDLHKRTLAIHTVDAAGILVRNADLPTRRDAVSGYFATLDGPQQAVCECTSMWYWVRDLLVPQGIDLRLAHAKYLKAISYAKVKTDAVDAATMAPLFRVQLIPEAHMIREGLREVRDLLRSRLVLVSRKRSRDGNRYLKIAFRHAAIRAIQFFPEVKAEFQRWHRRKGKPIARALIAKELATIVYAMLSKGEPFNKQFHGHPVVTQKRCTWPRLANPPILKALRNDWGARRPVDREHLSLRARRTV